MGVDGIISRQADGKTGYYFKDAHGNVVYIFGSGKYQFSHYDYTGWGEEADWYDWYSDFNPMRYCGEYYDKESGLTYLRGRYYSSDIKRFINEDPAKDGVNWYAYCGNNPIMLVDPWGLFSVIFTADIMSDQAEVRKNYYEKKYNTTCLVYKVDSAKAFEKEWNEFFSINRSAIDAIEIIGHGGASGAIGTDSSGTAYATGFIYFTSEQDDNYGRVFARPTTDMKSKDVSLDSFTTVDNNRAKEFNINVCNSANIDIYNIVFGFMQKLASDQYLGWDGGTVWDASVGDHVRGGGEYGTNWKHPNNPAYYMEHFQNTWWTYVEKNPDGSPAREREGRRTFNFERN